MMKILSPLDSPDEVAALAEAGAGEFFCGLLEESWYEQYPVISINRRPAGKGHFRKFGDLKEAVKRAHDLGIPVYFTLNEHYYVNEQYPFLERYIDGALDAAVDGLIVSDYGLMAYLHRRKTAIPLHVSTGGTVFNRRTAKFYCREFNVANITFPRHLAIQEVAEIINGIGPMQTTVFVLNSRCVNVDGFCTFQHGLAGKEIFAMFRNACMLPFRVSAGCQGREGEILPQAQTMTAKQRIWENVHVDDHPCGACALYEFQAIGINSFKIVGRGNPVERKVKDVVFLRQLMDFLEKEQPTKAVFRTMARKAYNETYQRSCRMHMCYYPSVMFDER